jgi:hypothetical protein
MQSTSAKAACEQLPKQKTYAPQKNSKPHFYFFFFRSRKNTKLAFDARWKNS